MVPTSPLPDLQSYGPRGPVSAMVAALYVETGGVYADVPGVDLWDETRDARRYAGPWPVVAHPPCARWCALAKQNEQMWGYKVGDDGGCFEAALAAVRRYGGVLEHPAFSLAWAHFGLPRPSIEGWQRTLDGEWVADVEQSHFGHPARKRTWLFASGINPPALPWGAGPTPTAVVNLKKVKRHQGLARLSGKATLRTPEPFRDILLSIARTVALSDGPTGQGKPVDAVPRSEASEGLNKDPSP